MSAPSQFSAASSFTILEAAVEGILIVEIATLKLIYANPAFSRIFGYTREEFARLSIPIIHPPEVAAEVESKFEAFVRRETKSTITLPCIRKNGEIFTADISAFRVELDGIPCICGFYSDVTELENARNALRMSEENYSKIFQTSPIPTAITRVVDGTFIDVNPAFTRLSGYDRSETIGRSAFPDDLGIWLSMEERNRMAAILKEKGELTDFETRLRLKNGTIIDGLMFARIVAIYGETCILAMFNDVTDLKQHTRSLYAEKERLRVTLHSIGDAVITTDMSGKVQLMNEVAEKLTGWMQAEAHDRPLSEVFHIVNELTGEPWEDPVSKVLSSGKVVELANHTCLISRDNTRFVIADSGAPIRDSGGAIIGVVLVFRDMTEKQKMLRSIQNLEKMESLGALAGGIAHDFNNLLGGIFGYIELVQETTREPATKEYLQSIIKTTNRARALTQQLLTFAKGGPQEKKTGPIFPFVKDTAVFALSGSNVIPRFAVDPSLHQCDFDKNQLGQVIDNLVINAKQAMPKGGTITIAASNVTVEAAQLPPLAPGEYVRISIVDEGCGIPKETLPRIFDPFFTTKEQGSGLGLANCYSIVNQHGGCIQVESVVGKGSTFHVYLPAAAENAVHAADAPPAKMKSSGSGRILLLDDEEPILETASFMLSRIGYSCICAKNGSEALQLFKIAHEKTEPFDLVICDLTIPGEKGGQEVVKKIRSINADIPIIVASGYSDDPVMANPEKYGFTGSICKPFTSTELAVMLEKHLQAVLH